jgi:type IV fimbrial biogenesis protein FimT
MMSLRDCSAPRQRGFTLIELMVVVAIAAILLMVAIPNMRAFYLETQRREGATALLAALNQARSAAVAYNTDTALCARTSAATPTCDNSSGASWQNGWLVYPLNSPTNILLVHDPLTSGVTLTGVSSPLTFAASGRTATTSTFALCAGPGDSSGRQVEVSRSGRISILYPAPAGTC